MDLEKLMEVRLRVIKGEDVPMEELAECIQWLREERARVMKSSPKGQEEAADLWQFLGLGQAAGPLDGGQEE